jgi:hypothetical protein
MANTKRYLCAVHGGVDFIAVTRLESMSRVSGGTALRRHCRSQAIVKLLSPICEVGCWASRFAGESQAMLGEVMVR